MMGASRSRKRRSKKQGTISISIAMDALTECVLFSIERSLGLRASECISEIIRAIADNQTLLLKLAKFAKEVSMPPRRRLDLSRRICIQLPSEDYDALCAIAKDILGENNRSAASRLLVTFYGVQHGLATLTWHYVPKFVLDY
jgi:hypothetical protein